MMNRELVCFIDDSPFERRVFKSEGHSRPQWN